MQLSSFIEKIQQELDELDLSDMTADTVFLDIPGWSSLYALVLMALLATEYNIELTAEQMSNIHTVKDAFSAVCARAS